MLLSIEKVKMTTEKILARLDKSRDSVILDKEKETEAIAAVIEAAEKALNLIPSIINYSI